MAALKTDSQEKILLIALVLCLIGCTTPAAPETVTPTTALTAEKMPTVTPRPSATPRPQSPPAPTRPRPTPTSLPVTAGPFRLVREGPAGPLHQLWVAPAGDLWAASGAGIFAHDTGGAWSRLYEGNVSAILGADAWERVWALVDGERAIASCDLQAGCVDWTVYGAEAGWEALPYVDYLSPGYGDIVAGPDGQVWFATGRNDLRRFDPAAQSWAVLRAADVGFEPVEAEGYQGHFLSDAAVDANGDLWVADCIGQGELLEGQGVRRFDGAQWHAMGDLEGQCVYVIEADAEGRIWIGGFDAIMHYDPAGGSWMRVELPPWERRQLVTDLVINWDGDPWVESMRYGGASPLGSVVRYHLEGGTWVTDLEGQWFSSLSFAPDGTAWLCAEGVVLREAEGRFEEVAAIPEGGACEIAVDGAGRIWALGGRGVWSFEPQGD